MAEIALAWATLTVSLFNTIAPLWLGLTVLLNAERRRWGAWVAGGGLILAGLLFAGHTAVIGRPLESLEPEMEPWWRLSWALFIVAPFLWYLVMAWFTGGLARRGQRLWLAALSLVGLGALALALVEGGLPSYAGLAASNDPRLYRLALYPIYSVVCIDLTLWTLRRPGPSDRLMGELARRRARPWLAATSLLLLLISLTVAGFAAIILYGASRGWIDLFSPAALAWFLRFDLLAAAMIALAIVLLGRAVVSYEIFTGTVLPRAGLARHWRRSMLLAAGYGALVGGSLLAPIGQVERLLLATLLMTGCLALLSWSAYRERERGIARLRPFVSSQHLYERLLDPDERGLAGVAALTPLARDVLGARCAYLVATGPLAALVGGPLAYHAGGRPEPLGQLALAALTAERFPTEALCRPVEPATHGGAAWALPLWTERGPAGVLLLGERLDGGLYTREELELARATAERLIDALATTELGRRLMRLQRQRLAESQVLDRHTRRLVHDEALPRLHDAILRLAGPEGAADREVVALLTEVHRQLADLLQAAPPALSPELSRLGLLRALRVLIEEEMRDAFDSVALRIEPAAATAAARLWPLAAEALYGAAREALRNAARHGRDGTATRPLHLDVTARAAAELEIVIEDDGIGIAAGIATMLPDGHGLALHSTMMAIIGGSMAVEGRPGGGTRVVLALPAAASEEPPIF